MITRDLLLQWNAAASLDPLNSVLSAQEVETLFPMQMGRSPKDLAEDARIALDFRLWLVCRALAYRNARGAREFGISRAAGVSHLAGRSGDQAAHAAFAADLFRLYTGPTLPEETLTDWLFNVNRARDAARDAQHSAPGDIPLSEAVDVAWEALKAAARYYVWEAANGAARFAAWAASRGGSWEAERMKALAEALAALGPDAEGWATDPAPALNVEEPAKIVGAKLSVLKLDVDEALTTAVHSLEGMRTELRNLRLERDHALLQVASAKARISRLSTDVTRLEAENVRLAEALLASSRAHTPPEADPEGP